MTEYRYKWVSTLLRGEPDIDSVEKAIKQGWEPVDVVPPDVEPIDGLTMDQTLRGMALYRMSETVVRMREAARNRQNQIEQDPQTHIDRANKSIAGYVEELNKEHGRTDAGKGWSPISGSGNVVVGSKPVWTLVTRDWKS